MTQKITKKHIIKEIIKCGRDPVYFIDTYAQIQHPVRGLIPFKMYEYQKDIVNAYVSHRKNIVLKARQLGVTTTTAAYITWLVLFHRDKNILIVATKQETAKNMIRIVKNIIKYLPRWMLAIAIDTGTRPPVDNRHSIEMDNGSRVKAVTTTSDVGRSEAVSFLAVDEVAHIPGFEEIWTGLWPVISCLQAGTRVLTLDGWTKIENLCVTKNNNNDFFEINNLKVFGKNGLERVSHGYISPKSKILKITTRRGLELGVTKSHPLYALLSDRVSMKPASELKVGDFLRVDVGMDIWGHEKLKNNLSYILGGYIAEGWITNKNTLIEISNFDDGFRKIYLENSVVKPFTICKSNPSRLRCSSVELIRLFQQYGIEPEWKCDTKRVPEVIWHCVKEDVCRFIQGYFDGDGCICSKGIIFSSTSKKLLQDLQLLLFNLGFVSTIHEMRRNEDDIGTRVMPHGKTLQSVKDAWVLVISLGQVKKFNELIGSSVNRKKTLLNYYSLKVTSREGVFYKVPLRVIGENFKKIIKKLNRSQHWLRKQGLRVDSLRSNISRNKIYQLLELCEDELSYLDKQFLEEIVGDFIWDEIVSIEEGDEEVTYDFTVPATHTFLQNGILGGNTGGCVALFSTPNGSANFFHRTFQQARNNENGFNCVFGKYANPNDPGEIYEDRFPWWVHPEHGTEWFDVEVAGKSPRDIAQEYLCSFLSSGDTFIYHETISELERGIVAPVKTFDMDRNVWIWEAPDPQGSYLISCDVSRGDSLDYSAFHVIRLDVLPLRQVAEYKGKIRPDQLGLLLVAVSKHYRNAIIAPENNSGWSGQAILKIQEADHPYIYYSRKRPGKTKQIFMADPYMAKDRNDYLPGYSVTSANRIPMLSKMEQYLRMRDIIIRSSRLVEEVKTFIVTSGNRPEAQRGMSDDLILALAGGLWVRDEAFLSIYRTDDVTKAMLDAMTISSNKSTDYVDMSFHKGSTYSRGRVRDYLQQENKMVMQNGEEIDLNWLLKD